MSEFAPRPHEVQQATIDDLPGLFGLLDVANDLCIAKSGVPDWPNVAASREDIRRHLMEGDVFVVHNSNGNVAATITLCETNAEWGEASCDNQALYLTKYMKNPATAQPGDTLKLLLFSAREAGRRQKPFIRGDAVTDQQGVIAYYKDKLGCVEKGRTVYKLTGREGILLENSTADFAERVNFLIQSTTRQAIAIETFSGGQAEMNEVAEFDLAIKQGVQAAGQKDFVDIRGGWRELKRLDRVYAAPGEFWVARDTQADNMLIGCVGLKELPSQSGLVGRLGVDERYRGHGLASRLMTTLVDYAQDAGFKDLALETGPKQHAIPLYESLGFLIVGTASDGDHVMRRELEAESVSRNSSR